MKTRKVLEINACGQHLKGYYEEGKVNPWRLYNVWWDGRERRRMIGKWGNFMSMMLYIKQDFYNNPEA